MRFLRVGSRFMLVGTLILLLGLSAGLARADDAPSMSRGVGSRVEPFALTNALNGQAIDLGQAAGEKATVLVFLGTDCPIGNLYLPRLVELEQQYRGQGVALFGINSNASESIAQIAQHAAEYNVSFPVLKDEGNTVADRLQANRTCEALVLDGKGILRYRGAIDDQYRIGVRRERKARPYLAQAIDKVLAGQEIETPGTSVDGCPIERVAGPQAIASERKPLDRVRPAPEVIVEAYRELEGDELPEVGEVTYAGQVAGILQNRCQSCHRPGQVGPFSLLTYDDAKRWATSIWEVVDDRRMPPWHADPRYGHFENDRHLSPKERATLISWVEQNCPSGDLASAPANPAFSEGWSVGTPDIVFEMPAPYLVQAEGTVPYQRFRVSTNFKEDVWVEAAEARPGDRSVVHHIIVYILPNGQAADSRRGPMHLCGYAPGDLPAVHSPGIGKRIPAGSDLIFEVHYTPIGKVREDRSSVGLIFSKQPVEREAITRGIANPEFLIPAGDSNHEVRSSYTFKQDSLLLSFMPHMHLRGKDFLYRATYPDGREEILLSVPAFDFNWQSYYRLAEPLKMPRGTRIDCVAHYDNSESNPANPASPPVDVRWGDQTWEEMMIGYIDYVAEAPMAPKSGERAAAAATSSTRSQALNLGRMLLRRAARSQPSPGTASTPATTSASP